jgi:hypothetical protein
MAFGWPWNVFTYGVTQNFNSPRFTAGLLICGGVWIGVVTVFSAATVGYEVGTIRTSDFNGTSELWYERFLPRTTWMPRSKICQSSTIKPGDGIQ